MTISRTKTSIINVLKQNPLDINLATDYLEILIKNGEYETAIKILKDYLALLPSEKRFYQIYSKLLILQGTKIQENNYAYKALGYLEAARVFSPDNASLLKKLGEIYLKLDHPHKAFKFFTESKDLAPDALINEKLIQAGKILKSKHNDNYKSNLSVCLASDLFGTKNGDANGPAFSKIDTLASLTSISNHVSVLTSFTPGLPDAIIEYSSRIKKIGTNEILFPNWYIANNNPAKKTLCLDEHMDSLSPDIVVTDGVRLGPHKMLKKTGFKLSCHKVFIHRATPDQYTGYFTKNDTLGDALQALSEYDFHISVSSRVMEEWKTHPELADKQWFHIPNCAREEEAEELLLKDKRQVRAQLGLTDDDFFVTCLASIQKRKGQDILLSLMPELVHRIPNIQILLVGPCFPHWGGKEIIELAKNSTNAKRIHILGPRYDALEIVYASDCMILPSREEALPRSILESMTLKTPVLASDVNGIPELIDDGIHGLLFSHDRPRQLTKKMERIAKDKEFRDEMLQNAYNKYWQNFSRAKHMERWKEVLDIIQSKSTE
jgi:glycosyltransferase involved in cell wall biosynthesis